MENNELKKENSPQEIIEDEKLFSQEVLDNIKTHKISPRPRWQFLFKNYFIWAIGFLALFFGAISISLIIFMLRYNGWVYFSRSGGGPLEFLLLVMPIFWISSLIVFVVLIYFNFKNTKHGYRYSHWLIVLGAIVLSIILGFGFFALGMGQRVDALLGRSAPLYDSVINPRLRFWSNPEVGRLSGLVVSKNTADSFLVVDNNNVAWEVSYVEEEDKKLMEAKELGLVDDEIYNITVGQPAIFLGEKTAEQEFKAEELVPFFPGREFFHRPANARGPRLNKNMMPGGKKNN